MDRPDSCYRRLLLSQHRLLTELVWEEYSSFLLLLAQIKVAYFIGKLSDSVVVDTISINSDGANA